MVVAQFGRNALDTYEAAGWGAEPAERSYYDRLFFPGQEGRRTGPLVPGALSGTIEQALDDLAQGFELASSEVQALATERGTLGSAVTAARIAELHHRAVLVRGLGLSVPAFLRLERMFGDVFATVSATVEFVSWVKSIQAAGLSAEDVAYVSAHVEHPGAPSAAFVSRLLGHIDDALAEDGGLGLDRARRVVEMLSTEMELSGELSRVVFPELGPNVAILADPSSSRGLRTDAATRLVKLGSMAEQLALSPEACRYVGLTDLGPWGGGALPVIPQAGPIDLSRWRHLSAFLELRRSAPAEARALVEAFAPTASASIRQVDVAQGSGPLAYTLDLSAEVEGRSLLLFIDVQTATVELDRVTFGGQALTPLSTTAAVAPALSLWHLGQSGLSNADDSGFVFSGAGVDAPDGDEFTIASVLLDGAGVPAVFETAADDDAFALGGAGALALYALSRVGPEPATARTNTTTLASLSGSQIAMFIGAEGGLEGLGEGGASFGLAGTIRRLGVRIPAATAASSVGARLEAQLGWTAATFDALRGSQGLGALTASIGMTWAARHFTVAAAAGLSPELIQSFDPASVTSTSLGVTEAHARRTREGLRASLGNEDYLERAAAIRAPIRERQQKALVAYTVLNTPTVSSPDELYGFLLIDVENTSAVTTSRLTQASASVQLFLQRASLGKEPAVRLSGPQREKWAWMRRYRVWEANRRLFLYPENYLLPELRRDKSELFETFEERLLEGQLTDEAARSAFGRYLDGLKDIGNLHPLAVYPIRRSLGEGSRANAEKSTLFIGREGEIGGRLYMQLWENELQWSGWRAVDLDVASQHVFPVELLGEQYLFWFSWAEMPPSVQSVGAVLPQDQPVAAPTIPASTVQGLLNYSVLREGRWAKARQGATPITFARGPGASDQSSLGEFVSQIRFIVRANEVQVAFVGTRQKWEADDGGSLPRQSRGTLGFDAADESTFMPAPEDVADIQFNFSDHYRASHQVLDAADSEVGDLTLSERVSDVSPHVALSTVRQSTQLVFPAEVDRVTAALPFVVRVRHRPYLATLTDLSEAEGERGKVLAPVFAWSGDLWDKYGDLRVAPPARAGYPSMVRALPFAQRVFRSSSLAAMRVPARTECTTVVEPIEALPASARNASAGLTVRFRPMFMAETDILKRRWLTEPFDAFFSLEAQDMVASQTAFDFETQFSPSKYIDARRPLDSLSFDPSEPYGRYGWETFFHAPVLVATSLLARGEFEAARAWVHGVFDPTKPARAGGSPWNFRPFEDWRVDNAGEVVAQLEAGEKPATRARKKQQDDAQMMWEQNPFEPHAVAQVRVEAYMRWTVFLYLDILIEWGDSLFLQDTFETVGEAAQLYVLAAEILGDEPVLLPGRSRPSESYQTLSTNGADITLGDHYIECVVGFRDTVTFSKRRASGTPALPSAYATPRGHFCTPVNDKLLGYWKLVQDRLFKIRNSQNLQGQLRTLALAAPPIDPLLLAKAVSSGASLSSLVSGGRGVERAPYRFQTVVQRALEFCGAAQGLAGQLQSALEREDAERLSQLVSEHRGALLESQREQREDALMEAQAQLAALRQSRESAEARHRFYAARKETNAREKSQLSLMEVAAAMHHVASSIAGSAVALASIPNVSLGAQGWASTPIGELNVSGRDLSAPLDHTSNRIQAGAALVNERASIAGVRAGHQRRFEDFQFQAEQATREMAQIDAQLAAAELRVALAEHELRLHDLSIEQQLREDETLRTKFTNQELYTWMISQVRQLYSRAYDLAHDMAKRAEVGLQFELRTRQAFVRASYWDTTRKGLLACEHMAHDLRRMQAEYTKTDVRELALTKHISLAQLAPGALQQIRDARSGHSATLVLTERMFDRDYPGHYLRRIRQVSITIPGVVGPYDGIQCKLTLNQSWIREAPHSGDAAGYVPHSGPNTPGGTVAETAPFRPHRVEQIVTSSAQRDGMVRNDDGRYLPFEGYGAVSQWTIEVPAAENHFDVRELSDVVLHIECTARAGGRDAELAARSAAWTEMDAQGNPTSEGTPLLLSLRANYPDAWQALADTATGGTREGRLTLERGQFPYPIGLGDVAVRGLTLFGRSQEGFVPLTGVAFTVSPGGALNANASFGELEGAAHIDLSGQPLAPQPMVLSVDGPTFDGAQLEDLYLVVEYGVGV